MKNKLLIPGLLLLLLSYSCSSRNGLGLNESASLHNLDSLTENPLLMHPLTTTVYPKDSIIAVLYGNDLAYKHAVATRDEHYPNGAVLYEIRWQFQPDEQWFGANIPERISTIERVGFNNNLPQYSVFGGDGNKRNEPSNTSERINSIIKKKIAVSP